MVLKYCQNVLLKNGKFYIAAIYGLTTIFYLQKFGIVSDLEASKYINEAKLLIKNGSFSASRYWFYSITIFIIAIALKLKIGLTGAFVLQALLNLFSYLIFYKALKKIFKLPLIAFFIVLYLLVFWPYQSWVVFLFTESAFFSLILILASLMIIYKPNNLKNISIVCLGLVPLLLARPLGIIFLVSIYFYFFYCANRKWKIILGAGSAAIIFFGLFAVNTIFSTITDWTITKAFEQESIICNLPTTTLSGVKLNLSLNGGPAYQLFYYITHNFFHFLHFAGLKLQYFFLMTRPYYSNAHNNFLLINLIPLYLLAGAGFFIKKMQPDKAITVFSLTTIILYAITIVIQCDDFHNRFILSIYPFFVILCAETIEYFILYFFKNYKHASSIGIKKTVS